MLLKPNLKWSKNQGIPIPSVDGSIKIQDNLLIVHFSVEESLDCFCSQIKEDNSKSYEDSCVEFFFKNSINPDEYYNFEITNRGYILAEVGNNRKNRKKFSKDLLTKVKRKKVVASVIGDLICWGVTIYIPAEILGVTNFNNYKIVGNLYKCADRAKYPHYLSLFPIDTEKPDFHRPEFFERII